MLAKVTNFGPPIKIPTCVGFFSFGRMESRYTDDPKVLKSFEHHSKREDMFLKIEVKGDDRLIDYTKYSIQELRSIASRMGVKGFFTMKKLDLIKNLEV